MSRRDETRLTDERSDARLLKESGRDAAAFGVFYDRHVHRVAGHFARRTADPALTADLTSETFAEAFASRRRYRDTGDPATAWLFTIAARQFNEYLRKERVSTKYRGRLGVDTDSQQDDFDRVDDLAELRERLPALEAALGTLTAASADAVTLRIGHGWSYARLGEHLGCTPGSARVRVSRALHHLEQRLTTSSAPATSPATQGDVQ